MNSFGFINQRSVKKSKKRPSRKTIRRTCLSCFSHTPSQFPGGPPLVPPVSESSPKQVRQILDVQKTSRSGQMEQSRFINVDELIVERSQSVIVGGGVDVFAAVDDNSGEDISGDIWD